MRIAVLPFNAAEGASEPLARQLAVLLSELLRLAEAGDEVGAINYMAQEEKDGVTRYVLANPTKSLNEPELLGEIAQNSQPDVIIDGLLTGAAEEGSVTLRRFGKSYTKPDFETTVSWTNGSLLAVLTDLFIQVIRDCGGELPDERTTTEALFQTSNDSAFVNWLTALDGLQYIDRAQGMVQEGWSPKEAIDAGLLAAEAEQTWVSPSNIVLEICRRCFQFQIGTPDLVRESLEKLVAVKPDDALNLFQIGAFYSDAGDPQRASDLLEKAGRLEPTQQAIWARLGLAQLQLNMPVNAERSLRKSIEIQTPETFDAVAWDFLSQVLGSTNRGHEIAPLWKGLIKDQPQNTIAHARLAQTLLANGQRDEAIKALDSSLETLDDTLAVKRVYAPLLKEDKDYDRAMDFYEDVLEEVGNDIPLMLEYADALVQADRAFEAEKVLRDVIEVAPDPNTKAQAQAWLIEIEQPKRVEILESANKMAEAGDVQGAIKELKPLRNWLADYWKLWVFLASLHNRAKEFGPAEEAAKRALELFPACEPAISELANSLMGQERFEESYHLMGNALQAFNSSLGIAIQFGLAASRFGRKEESRGMARQIREAIGPNSDIEAALAEMEA